MRGPMSKGELISGGLMSYNRPRRTQWLENCGSPLSNGNLFLLMLQSFRLFWHVRTDRYFLLYWEAVLSTGWSKATVTSNFSLARLKITKNGITQPFLESLYAAILIFQCLSMVRWQKLCLSKLCLNIVFAPYCKDWEPTYPPNASESLQFLWIPLRYPSDTPQTSPRHPHGISR